MNAKISIIIPCYNSEKTLEDTLESVLYQNFYNWEAIIINDGSKDRTEEISKLWLKKDNRFKYYKNENKGLASARNFGIRKAIGDYILPLDSDNKIRKKFIENAIGILDSNKGVGVVYGNAKYFGDKNGIWYVGEFDKNKILYRNYIDACAVIRKTLYDAVGLYEENLPYQGHEDWEFWLKTMSSTYSFYYLNEITFDYRVSKESMIRMFDVSMFSANYKYIKNKHSSLYIDGFDELFEKNRARENKEANYSLFGKIKRFLKKIKLMIK